MPQASKPKVTTASIKSVLRKTGILESQTVAYGWRTTRAGYEVRTVQRGWARQKIQPVTEVRWAMKYRVGRVTEEQAEADTHEADNRLGEIRIALEAAGYIVEERAPYPWMKHLDVFVEE